MSASAGRPHPATTRDTAGYWEGAQAHRLLVQRCRDCAALRHPPTAGCRTCGSPSWEWIECSGRGRVYSWTRLHAPLAPPFQDGHVVVLVELEEGVRVVSELVGEGGAVAIGMDVVCEFLDCDRSLSLPVFRAVAS